MKIWQQHVLAGTITAVVLAGSGYVGWLALEVSESGRVDPATLCRTDRPLAAHTVMLVDQTDALTEAEAQALRATIDEEARNLAPFGKLTVLLIDAATPYEPRTMFGRCAPRRARDVRWFDGNPELEQQEWDSAFGAPLDEAIAALRRVPTQPRSPIVESIVAAVRLRGFGPEVAQRRLVIVSDMLQNTEGFTQYRGGAQDHARYARTGHGQQHRLDLAGVAVIVHYLARPNVRRLQTEVHRMFWRELFLAAGASVALGPPGAGGNGVAEARR